MRPRMKAVWAATALASLLLSAPGCVIRRGFVVQFDWSLSAHRTGCRHQWFKGRCRTCNALPCEVAACETAPCGEGDDSLDGAIEAAPTGCDACAPRCRRGLRGRFGGFWRSADEIPPPAPEPPGPSNFHPVPTQPVYGIRSEQPDAAEAPMERLAPVPLENGEGTEDEAPDEGAAAPGDEMEEAPDESPGEQSASHRSKSLRRVRSVNWQQTGRHRTLAVPQCQSCTIRFK